MCNSLWLSCLDFLLWISLAGRAVNSGVRKRVVSKRVVLADVPGPPKRTGTRVQKQERGYNNRCSWTPKPERGYKKQIDGTKNRNKGTPKLPFTKTPFCSSRKVWQPVYEYWKSGRNPLISCVWLNPSYPFSHLTPPREHAFTGAIEGLERICLKGSDWKGSHFGHILK